MQKSMVKTVIIMDIAIGLCITSMLLEAKYLIVPSLILMKNAETEQDGNVTKVYTDMRPLT